MSHITHNQIIERLGMICPATQWTLTGNHYSGLSWHDVSPKPSRAELGLHSAYRYVVQNNLAAGIKQITAGIIVVITPADFECWADFQAWLQDGNTPMEA